MEVWHRGRTTLSKRSLHWYGEVCVGYVLGFVTLYSHVLVNGGRGVYLFCRGFGGFAPIKGSGSQLIPGVMYLGLAYAVGTTIPKYL